MIDRWWRGGATETRTKEQTMSYPDFPRGDLSVTYQPLGESDAPTCRMYGVIPAVEFGGFPSRLAITLGNHEAPAAYLREWARRLERLADEIDASKPVPFVPAETTP